MNLEALVKYLMWIVLFGIALVGIYILLSRLGAI
jgi:hypothetical protein